MAFCFDDLEGCDECHEQTVNDCNDVLIDSTNLTPASTFVLFVIDRYGNQYTTSVSITGSGAFVIDLQSFIPLSLFNSFGNKYEIFLSPTADPIVKESLTISGVSKDCVLLTYTVNCCVTDDNVLEDESGNVLADENGNFLIDG